MKYLILAALLVTSAHAETFIQASTDRDGVDSKVTIGKSVFSIIGVEGEYMNNHRYAGSLTATVPLGTGGLSMTAKAGKTSDSKGYLAGGSVNYSLFKNVRLSVDGTRYYKDSDWTDKVMVGAAYQF